MPGIQRHRGMYILSSRLLNCSTVEWIVETLWKTHSIIFYPEPLVKASANKHQGLWKNALHGELETGFVLNSLGEPIKQFVSAGNNFAKHELQQGRVSLMVAMMGSGPWLCPHSHVTSMCVLTKPRAQVLVLTDTYLRHPAWCWLPVSANNKSESSSNPL